MSKIRNYSYGQLADVGGDGQATISLARSSPRRRHRLARIAAEDFTLGCSGEAREVDGDVQTDVQLSAEAEARKERGEKLGTANGAGQEAEHGKGPAEGDGAMEEDREAEAVGSAAPASDGERRTVDEDRVYVAEHARVHTVLDKDVESNERRFEVFLSIAARPTSRRSGATVLTTRYQ